MTSVAPSEPRRSKAEKFWDRLARTWGKPPEESEQTDTKVLAKTRPYLKATDTVLDYGCAMGSVDLKLAAAVKAIHGIDISSKMIAAAREAAEARKVANLSFAKATVFARRASSGTAGVHVIGGIAVIVHAEPSRRQIDSSG